MTLLHSKHNALQQKVQQYLHNTSGSLSQFRTLTTQYRNSQIPANQYVASLSNLFGSDADKTGKIIQSLYEVLDSETKKAEMMRAWRDFKTVQSQFPSLESRVVTNPTMADIAAPPARRVLVIKQAKPRSTSTSAWERAAAAASSVRRTDSPSGSKSASTPVFYPTPQLNSTAAWSVPKSSADNANALNNNNNASSGSSSRSSGNRGPSAPLWAGVSQGSGKSAPTPLFQPSTANRGRPAISSEQFPSLVSQAPLGTKPSLGLFPTQNKNQEDTNGWVAGWGSGDMDDEPVGGKKKKKTKTILFHAGYAG